MTHHITAYCRGSADRGYYDLTDWNGKTILELNDSRITIAETYHLWESATTDKAYAVVYRLPNNRGWIVGYAMGDGCLFRGEYLPNPTRSHCDMDTSDAERYAKQVAEYWIGRDDEDDIAFQEEMRLEEELNSWEDVIKKFKIFSRMLFDIVGILGTIQAYEGQQHYFKRRNGNGNGNTNVCSEYGKGMDGS